ncbi:Structural maintenance of chromosomes protein 2 [Trichoplax sp. H2]|nr:Structural maintenance of chromosomes protein 2 [Trichoplax sp. H2]|eukprot:RDD42260.1 Structural maintenance of chromosomes protein 2 [Trichoplax sp. H2]
MHIKQVVIDGFKSYAQRTEVNNFDPLFNAITGLNGSGKSNILDSICFVLGISNLQQVRAGSLQDLVYKSGQAGVTKATVTITFDNQDKKQSPLGYETHDEITVTRQVVIGGRNKYLINGVNANNTRVQDLFRSVQLNVNNPHFLIMQGRITKVLNMKPPEILAMIEEAAGTRMYESKKASAQRTIEKKESKLVEISNILNDEITPTLNKLKQERSSYLEYQKITREIEHLTKLCVAYNFICAEELKENAAEKFESLNACIEALKEKLNQIDSDLEKCDAAIAELEKKRDNEMSNKSIKALEQQVDALSKEHVKVSSVAEHAVKSLQAEKKQVKEIEKARSNEATSLKEKQNEIEQYQIDFTKLQEKSQSDADAFAASQKHFQAVSAGLSEDDNGEDKTLADQLMTAKKDISTAETEIKQAEMKLKHDQGEIKNKQKESQGTEKKYKEDKKALDSAMKRIEQLKDKINQLNYEEEKENQLGQKKNELKEKILTLTTTTETLEAKFPNMNFEYKNPTPKFDRKKVRGLVAGLVTVKDVSTATALEVTAGNKLYSVVVDTEETGKQLLKNGQLKRRFTIIPLNQIASSSISEKTVAAARRLVGKENVHTALSLVGYDNELEAAMSFIFGSTLVCNNIDNAKIVTFNEDVKKRTVTLEGDILNPSGTLTGGSRPPPSSSILAKLSEINDLKQELQQKSNELTKVASQLASIEKIAEEHKKVSRQLGLAEKEASLLQNSLEQSSHYQLLEEITSLQKAIDEQKDKMKAAKETIKNASNKCTTIEKKMKDAKSLREKELKSAEKKLTAAKAKSEESTKQTKLKFQEIEALKLEAAAITQEIANLDEQILNASKNAATMEDKVKSLDETLAKAKADYENAKGELESQRTSLRACNKEISKHVSERQSLAKAKADSCLEMKDQMHQLSKLSKDSKDAAQKVASMIAENDWIATEKQFFGQPNTAYDFKANNPKEASKRLLKLEETKEKLSKTVNMRAMNMLGKVEEKYNDLMKKKKIVENDKKKIESTILELDKKKKEHLSVAFAQVTKDFSSIFSTLLPGATAKLSAPENQTIFDGLEVKVGFGQVWKESLSELSGGQRSLVALSLILSLLLFKPAPIYILDEVDAALDLSHTQNIGQMLRTHFKHSQFIVVSLKDGMFNNANVLFKTKFVDGVSTVTRHEQVQSRKQPQAKKKIVSGKVVANESGLSKRAKIK